MIFDGKSLGTFSPTSRICVYGGGGNDTISVSQQVTVPAWLYTENGNVQLMGGGGPTLLMGGPGKDTLWGGSGPAIMIGGSGSNSLLAGSGGAVLVGATAYDDNPAGAPTNPRYLEFLVQLCHARQPTDVGPHLSA